MGKLETRVKKRARRKNLERVILGVVGAAGVLGVGLVAAPVVGALAKMGFKPRRWQAGAVNRARARLVKKGLLKYQGNKLRLTPAGEARLHLLEMRDFALSKPRRWDKKWRVLIFDIPETKRALRQRVRNTLRSIGFARLQDSVWVYPYPCEDLITLLKADFKIGKDLLYLVVEEIEYDTPLKKFFGVK